MTPLLYGVFGALGYGAALYDSGSARFSSSSTQHNEHEHNSASHSTLTGYLFSFCATGSILETILRERDTRRIALFGL
jgi:solute carrier family 30 (zinc transporter), member 5/7